MQLPAKPEPARKTLTLDYIRHTRALYTTKREPQKKTLSKSRKPDKLFQYLKYTTKTSKHKQKL